MGLIHRPVRKNSRSLVELLLRYVPEKSGSGSNLLTGLAGLTPLHIAAGKDRSEDVLDALTDDPLMHGKMLRTAQASHLKITLACVTTTHISTWYRRKLTEDRLLGTWRLTFPTIFQPEKPMRSKTKKGRLQASKLGSQ